VDPDYNMSELENMVLLYVDCDRGNCPNIPMVKLTDKIDLNNEKTLDDCAN